MSNPAKNADYTSDEEEEEESESEEEEQAKAVKGKDDAKMQDRHPQEGEESSDGEEEEEDSESDENDENDAKRYMTMQRDRNAAVGAKATNSNNPVGKRGRDDEGKDEEPASKKSKDSKGDKGRVLGKPGSPSRSNKSDPNGKGGKAQVPKSKSEKGKSGETTKAAAATKKRKASPSLPNGSSKQKGDSSEKNSPPKIKTTPFMWTNNLETALATMLWNDKKHGRPIPSGTRNDAYWTKLVKELGSEGVVISETQLSEKVRRMKTKWRAYKGREAENPWKTAHEKTLYGIWESIWGNGSGVVKQPAHPGTARGPNEDEEEESSDEEKEVPPATLSIKGVALPSRKEELSESESEEEVPKKGGGSHDGISKDGTVFSPTSVVSPFVSKPRLEYTPVVPKDKKKGSRGGEDGSIAEQSGGEASPDDEDGDGQASAAVLELLSSLKKESFEILHEVRASCWDVLNSIRKQTSTAVMDDMKDVNSGLGVHMPSSGMWRMNGGPVSSLDRRLFEDFMTNTLRAGVNGTNDSKAAELKTHWRQLRADDMDLLEQRNELSLKQLQLAKKQLQLARKDLQLARKEFDEQDN